MLNKIFYKNYNPVSAVEAEDECPLPEQAREPCLESGVQPLWIFLRYWIFPLGGSFLSCTAGLEHAM